MITQYSKLDEARNDTLITKAGGNSLTRLSRVYGFDRPLFVSEETWRSALKRAVYGSRGTLGILFDFTYYLFKEFSTVSTYSFTCNDADQLTYVGTQNPCQFISRLIKINGSTYFLQEILSESENNGEYTATFILPTFETTYFKKLGDSILGQTVQGEILPFIFEEYGGVVRLLVDSSLVNIPSTYLKVDANDTSVLGGYLLDYFSLLPENRLGEGKYPIYLLTEEFGTRFFDMIKQLLASGIQLKGETFLWCEEDPMYATIDARTNYGSADPLVAVSPQPARS